MDCRPPADTQLARDLPGPVIHITGHNEAGKSVVTARRQATWGSVDEGKVGLAVAYTNKSHPNINDGADIAAHDATTNPTASKPLGLVLPGGTVLRYVDFAPGHECMMHRTQSLDYGIILEGAIESCLDSGEVTRLERGDVMVQRGTMHSWRNPSETEWARMIFCLQDSQPIVVNGKRLKEDLGGAEGHMPPSGNDV